MAGKWLNFHALEYSHSKFPIRLHRSVKFENYIDFFMLGLHYTIIHIQYTKEALAAATVIAVYSQYYEENIVFVSTHI